MLVTRPEPAAGTEAEALSALGLAPVLWPITGIRHLATRLALPEGTEALVFTSAHGVAAFAAASRLRDLPAYCVGARTAEAARAEGFVDARSADGDAAALARLLAGAPETRFFHARGENVAGDLAGALAAPPAPSCRCRRRGRRSRPPCSTAPRISAHRRSMSAQR